MTLFATLGFRNNTCSQWQTDKLGALLFSCVQVLFRPEKLQYCGADQKDESRYELRSLQVVVFLFRNMKPINHVLQLQVININHV
jgi:hypothetical protein